MNKLWFVFFCYYRIVTRDDFIVVSVTALDSSKIGSDEVLYELALKSHKDNKAKYGLGLTLIIHAGDDIPSSFVGNPLLEEDHEERQRVFFEDKIKFFETLEG